MTESWPFPGADSNIKKVLSVSLGSSTRDHTTEAEFLRRRFWLSRQGVDGDFDRYLAMCRQYDGRVSTTAPWRSCWDPWSRVDVTISVR